jgi:DNA-binding response OmpR family regulator
MNILMLQGAEGVANFLERGLAFEGWSLTRVASPEQARACLSEAGCDLVLIDVDTFGSSQLAFARRLRDAWPEMQILLLLPKPHVPTDFPDKMLHVLHKPFSFDKLIDEIERLRMPGEATSGSRFLFDGALRLDPAACRIDAGDRVIDLTRCEASLIRLLMQYPGRAFACERLAEEMAVRTDECLENPVATTVRSLREKLGAQGVRIKTVRNYGYRLESVT